MKRILCVLIATLCLCTCWAGNGKKPIVWEQPVAESNQLFNDPFQSRLNIYRVEFADDETRVFMHITFRPHYWVKFVKETYLLADGKKYLVKSCDGLKLDEKHYIPSSGKEDVVFHFAPLPKKTRKFDFLEGDGKDNFKILGIESFDTRSKRLFSSLWRNDATGDWEIGFYDDFAIYDCRYWQYKQKSQKGNKYSFILTDGKSDLAVNIDKPKQGKRTMSINGKKAEYSLITTFSLPDYPQKDETTSLKDTHNKPDTAIVVGWLRNMPKELWDRGQEYSVVYYDLFSTFKEVSSYSKLDSLGRFEIKVPLINSTEVFMDWKHNCVNTVLEPGETYYLLYDFKAGHAIFMGKNCRLQNELLAHPIPRIDAEYPGKYENKVPAQEMMQILESRYKEAEGNLRKQIEKSASISRCYQEYAAQYLLCTYATDILQGAYHVKDHIFPQEYVSQMEKIWKEIPQPYTQFRDYSMLTKDLIDREARLKYSTPMGKTFGFLFTNYYPELLRKHKAQGDIAITDSEIATVEQWAKDLEAMTIKQNQTTDAKEQEEIENAFSNSDLAKRATAILEREDIAKMLKDETPLIDVYYAQHIADSMGCNQQQKDVIISKAFLEMLERRAIPLNSYGLDLAEHGISSEVIREKVLAEHRKYLSLQNKDITVSVKTAPQDISDGEKLLRHILEPYKGKLVLLDVWGTWCSPCKKALAHSKEEFERLAPYDVVYLYMANSSPEESWKNIIKLYDLVGDNIAHYRLPAAQQSAIENYLNIHSFPSYRLFDKEGNLVDMKVDARQLDNLERIIKKLSK